jgi:hypothetical protein
MQEVFCKFLSGRDGTEVIGHWPIAKTRVTTKKIFTTGSTGVTEETQRFPLCFPVSSVVNASWRNHHKPSLWRSPLTGSRLCYSSTVAASSISTSRVNQVSGAVVSSAMKVHSLLGPASWKALITHVSQRNCENVDTTSRPKLVSRLFTRERSWNSGIVSTS